MNGLQENVAGKLDRRKICHFRSGQRLVLNLQIIPQVGTVKGNGGVGGWDHEGPVGYDGGKYEIRGANTL